MTLWYHRGHEKYHSLWGFENYLNQAITRLLQSSWEFLFSSTEDYQQMAIKEYET